MDEEIKVQHMYDILPANIEQHLILESRDKEAKYEEKKASRVGSQRGRGTRVPGHVRR